MKKGTCKLCGEYKNLLKHSHIYPSFIYKGVFYHTKRTVLASLKDNRAPRFYQTGFYDKNVLCVIMSSSEDWNDMQHLFCQPPTSNAHTNIVVHHENDQLTTVYITGMDYKQL